MQSDERWSRIARLQDALLEGKIDASTYEQLKADLSMPVPGSEHASDRTRSEGATDGDNGHTAATEVAIEEWHVVNGNGGLPRPAFTACEPPSSAAVVPAAPHTANRMQTRDPTPVVGPPEEKAASSRATPEPFTSPLDLVRVLSGSGGRRCRQPRRKFTSPLDLVRVLSGLLGLWTFGWGLFILVENHSGVIYHFRGEGAVVAAFAWGLLSMSRIGVRVGDGVTIRSLSSFLGSLFLGVMFGVYAAFYLPVDQFLSHNQRLALMTLVVALFLNGGLTFKRLTARERDSEAPSD